MTWALVGTRTTAMRRLTGPGILAILVALFLAGLGVWQMQRLAEKDALIEAIVARTTAPPVALPPEADWPRLVPDAYAYRHVRLQGVYDETRRVFVFRTAGVGIAKTDGAGFVVMVPLRLASGAWVIVDRGFIPQAMRDAFVHVPADAPGPHVVTGLLRPPEPRNTFTPADDPGRGQWFTRDPAAIAASQGLQRAAPFSVDVDATPPGQWPKGGQTVVDIPNDHLSYALTWFGLAITALGVFLAFAVTRLRAIPR